MGAEVSGAQVSTGDTLVDGGVFTEHSISPQSAILQRETRHHQNGGRKDMLFVKFPQNLCIFFIYYILLICLILYNYVELIICILNHYFSVILNAFAHECKVKKLLKFLKVFQFLFDMRNSVDRFWGTPSYTRCTKYRVCAR